MPSRRILLLFRHPGAIDLASARVQVAALRRCAGIGDVMLGVPEAKGIRLLSPWLFLGDGSTPEGIGLQHLETDIENCRDPALAAALARAIWQNPLSIRPLDALRDLISGICLADPAAWADEKKAELERSIPLLPAPAAAASFRARGRIRPPDTGGAIRILALNACDPEAQTMLGRFIHELGIARRQVELLDYREPDATMPSFVDGMHVRHLDPSMTDQSAEPWHLVILGRELPFRFRQFTTLTARLWLFSRPTALFHDHRPVAVSLDASKLLFELRQDEAAHFHALAATTDEWQLVSLRNADLLAGGALSEQTPLAVLLSLAQELEQTRAPFAPLVIAERFRQRLGVLPDAGELLRARQFARRGYEPLADPAIVLSLASEMGRLLAITDLGALQAATFARFLRRPSEAPAEHLERTSLRKRIDVINGAVASREYARITPAAIASVTRDLVASLHRRIFESSSPEQALSMSNETSEDPGQAITAACCALVASHLALSADVRG